MFRLFPAREIEMSAKSQLLRSIYGIEPRPRVAKSKYAFYQEQRAQRGEILRRAAQEHERAVKRKSSMAIMNAAHAVAGGGDE